MLMLNQQSDKKLLPEMPEMPEMPEITMPLVATSFTFMTGLKLLGIIIIIAFRIKYIYILSYGMILLHKQ